MISAEGNHSRLAVSHMINYYVIDEKCENHCLWSLRILRWRNNQFTITKSYEIISNTNSAILICDGEHTMRRIFSTFFIFCHVFKAPLCIPDGLTMVHGHQFGRP